MRTYDPTDQVRLEATFRNTSNALANPSTVTLVVQKPDMSHDTYVYGTDAEVVRDSTGVYHVDVQPEDGEEGIWVYRWRATGTVQQATEGTFFVRPSRITE